MQQQKNPHQSSLTKKWDKLGLVYASNMSNKSWMHTHAFLPTPLLINEDVIRVFASFWDKNKIGRIGYVDVSAKNPKKILYISTTPSLDIGNKGNFDDSGVTPSCVVKNFSGTTFLFYIGWQRQVNIPYTLFSGLATSNNDGVTFTRIKETPILDRNPAELYLRTAPFVLEVNSVKKMWYLGGSAWETVNNKLVPNYEMKYSSSVDGINWNVGTPILSPNKDKGEYGFGRPYIFIEDNTYKMFYSIRSKDNGYRIGYAESSNGINWNRLDHLSHIDVSKKGWDSKMICFGSIINTKYGRYMFYNGNEHGKDGFGVAVWK